jgi:predicted Co/Zn/Cd cation transporter (cation efflux family)
MASNHVTTHVDSVIMDFRTHSLVPVPLKMVSKASNVLVKFLFIFSWSLTHPGV